MISARQRCGRVGCPVRRLRGIGLVVFADRHQQIRLGIGDDIVRDGDARVLRRRQRLDLHDRGCQRIEIVPFQPGRVIPAAAA